MQNIRHIFNFCLLFTGILAACEFYIQGARITNVSATEFYGDIGRGRRADFDFLYFSEGFGIGKFNKYRYIGEARPPEKPENTIRIALLGDSFIESYQVFERDYFGKVMESALSAEYPGSNFEVLNFGRAGFDIADMYAYKERLINRFDPDFIFYMVSISDLKPKYKDPLRLKTIILNDTLLIQEEFSQRDIDLFNRTKFFTQNICLVNMLNDCIKKSKKTPVAAILFEKAYSMFTADFGDGSEDNKEDQPFSLSPVTRKIIEEADPVRTMVINRDQEMLPLEFTEQCRMAEIRIIDLSPLQDSLRSIGSDPFYWKATNKEGHWNHEAHRHIGLFLADELGSAMDKRSAQETARDSPY